MLLGDLFTYEIVEKSKELIKAQVHINAGHEVFNGHFPGVPVLPGVCQVQAIKELLQDVTGEKLLYAKVRDIKFMAMVIPTEMPVLECNISFSDEGEAYKVSAALTSGESNILKLRGNLTKA